MAKFWFPAFYYSPLPAYFFLSQHKYKVIGAAHPVYSTVVRMTREVVSSFSAVY